MTEVLHAGGELLLLGLFVLFSVVSALLEHRKRKKQAEEARQGRPPQEVEEEEEEGSWPFPMGGDPFELSKRRPQAPQPEERAGDPAEVAGEVPAEQPTAREPVPAPMGGLLQEIESQAREAELQAREQEVAAREAERQARQVQPRRRVQELVREQVASAGRGEVVKKRPKWLLTPKTARDAVVYMVILGRPKADREGEEELR